MVLLNVMLQTGPDFTIKTKPYLHEAIVSVLHDKYFSADKGPCLVVKFVDSLKSSIPGRPDEVEVTPPMAAFAATCV